MRQQEVVIQQQNHPSTAGRGQIASSNNHHRSSTQQDDTPRSSRLSNGSSRNGNGVGHAYDCTDEAINHRKYSPSGNGISSSIYHPSKTQIISGSGPTLERVTQFHTSHSQHNNNNNTGNTTKCIKIYINIPVHKYF